MPLYNRILQNNKKWVADRLSTDPEFFIKLSRTQTPEILYIGCSDSRVPANEIMGLEPGEVFVHRNIANQVVGTDMNVNAVVQYAVEYLHVQHIIVCGHYGCGGVKAAMGSQDMGELNAWLQNIRDVYRLHQSTLNSIDDENERYRALVELNVLEQCINVAKMSYVQRSWKKTGFPKVHGWVYDLANGYLIDLKIDIEQEFKGISQIYDLGALGS